MKITCGSLVLLSMLLVSTTNAVNERLKEVFAWKEMDYAFPSPEARQEAIDKGTFVPANNLPLGLDVSKGRLFITVPRWKPGVASSLNYVDVGDDAPKDKSPVLIPYPSWEANSLPGDEVQNKSTHIISTFRVRADACRRLWVMDTGIANFLSSPKHYTSPKLLVYDLETDNLLRVYHLKQGEDVKDDSLFANVVVDVTKDDCENAYAYLPDVGGSSLLVYSWKNNESWKIKHHYFHFDPLQGNFNVAGINFQWSDGLFGISMSPRGEDGYRTLYFHPFSSINEFAVSSKIVQNKTIASDSHHEYKLLGSRGNNTQSTTSFIDEESGVMFYTLINKNAVGCWNTNKPVSEANQGIVAQDDESLVYVNDLKVCNERYLWVLSDKLPLFLYRNLNSDEINYRILNARVPDLIKDTVCE